MIIEYCNKCGYRIDENEFQSGSAVQVGERIYCKNCVPEGARTIPVRQKPRRSSKCIVPVSGRQIVRPTTKAAHAPSANRTGLFLFMTAAGFIAAGVFFAFYFGGNVPATQPQPTPANEAPGHHSADEGKKINASPEAPPMSMLLNNASPAELKAQSEFDVIIKLASTKEKIERLKQFIADKPPDWDVSARARVAYNGFKDTSQKPTPVPKSAELVGWWKLDDQKGKTISDSSNAKHHGTIVGSPAWVSEAPGGIHFQNDGDYIEIPNSPVLDTLQESDYSVSALFKPDSNPAEEKDHVHCGYSIVAKGGNHSGLLYYHGGFFSMDHWLSNNVRVTAVAKGTYPPDKFYHLVGIVSRTEGQTRIYVDAKLAATRSWSQGAATRNYGRTTWKIGIALPGKVEWSWPAKGVIRDVRIYKGVLSENEIKALSGN
jgi:hypothetical protein